MKRWRINPIGGVVLLVGLTCLVLGFVLPGRPGPGALAFVGAVILMLLFGASAGSRGSRRG